MGKREDEIRREMLEELWSRVEKDTYPSATMLDRIEHLMSPDDVPAYVEMLMARIRAPEYPSIDLINRVLALVHRQPYLDRRRPAARAH